MNNTTPFYYAIAYSGCFFGAGFVAGNEMRDFFGKFGIWGFIPLAVSLFICAITTYRIMVLKNIYSYKDYETLLFGTNKKVLKFVFAFAKHLFMLGLITFCTSCAGEILYRISGADPKYGALLLILITLTVSLSGKSGVLRVFSISVPLISIFCLIYAVIFSIFGEKNFSSIPNIHPNGLCIPFLYAGYNIFAGVGTFPLNYPNQAVKKGLFLGSIILLVCGSSVLYLTLMSQAKGSMPVFDIIYSNNNILGFIFSILLFLSLISTAVSRTFMLFDEYSKNYSSKKYICVIICTCAYILSFIGFNTIIKLIYPIFGIIGTVSVIIINLKYRIKISTPSTKLFCVGYRR